MPKGGYEFEKQEQHITKCMYEYAVTFKLWLRILDIKNIHLKYKRAKMLNVF